MENLLFNYLDFVAGFVGDFDELTLTDAFDCCAAFIAFVLLLKQSNKLSVICFLVSSLSLTFNITFAKGDVPILKT